MGWGGSSVMWGGVGWEWCDVGLSGSSVRWRGVGVV